MNTFGIKLIRPLALLLHGLVLVVTSQVLAQPGLPPRVMTVRSMQSLYFGTMSVMDGAGKSVTVSPVGIRTASGNIQLLSHLPLVQPAIFEIKFAPFRNIAVSYSVSTTLTGSLGGTIELIPGPSDKGENGASFITEDNPNFITRFQLGGTLLFHDQSPPPGTYIGYYAITFHLP